MQSIGFSSAQQWLVSRHYDLAFFHLPALIGLLWLVPFYLYGPSAIFYIYIGQSLIAGIPHLYLTWFSLASPEAQSHLRMGFVYGVAAIALLGASAIVYYLGSWISNLLISITFFLAGWHSHKQHLGIMKLYTFVQTQRWQDRDLSEEIKPLQWFYFFAMNTLFVFSFTRPEITYQVTTQRNISLLYPTLPAITLPLYLGLTAALGLWAFYRTVYVRHFINKKPLPWPQMTLAALTVSIAAFMYLTLPPKAYMLLWIVPAFGHNVQYMAYVWLFERNRITHLENVPQEKPHQLSILLRLVKNRRWFFYFLPVYAATFLSMSLGTLGFEVAAVALVHFITIFHYIGDGFFWKKDINRHVKPVSNLILNYGSDCTRPSSSA